MKPAGLFKFRLPLDTHTFEVMINIYSIYIIIILADKYYYIILILITRYTTFNSTGSHRRVMILNN
jgi:hypothetical protein